MRGDPAMWRIGIKYSAVGLEMGLSAVIGLYGGTYLDKKFGTTPYFAYGLLGCGIAAGFVTLFRLARARPARPPDARLPPS